MFRTRTKLILGGLLAFGVILAGSWRAWASKDEAPQLAHMVYFKLKDSSDAAKAKFTAACKVQLTAHEGTVFFGAGTLADDIKGELNDREYDVSLHLVFTGKEALDKYLVHPRHLKFVAENKDNFAKVRVFDSYLSPGGGATSGAGAGN